MNNAEETRVDLHVKILDDRVRQRAKRCGIDVLVYAPHFTPLPTIRRRARAYSDEELTVIPARELFTGTWNDRRHVLAIGLDDPVPDFIGFERALAELECQDAAVLIPHPTFLTMSLSTIDIERHREAIDAIEVFNPKFRRFHDRRTREIAARSGLPVFGSSYAHLHRTVGEVWTAFEDAIGSAADLLAALESGAPRRVVRRSGRRHRLRCDAEFAHLAYENTVKKLRRARNSRLEATHPDRPTYEGRFEAV